MRFGSEIVTPGAEAELGSRMPSGLPPSIVPKGLGRRRFLTIALSGASLGACGAIERPPFLGNEVPGEAPALAGYRFNATDVAAFLKWQVIWADRRRALGLDGVRVLALSGGGADGAYGAGVLVGWTRSGRRPVFDLVTGVSTGALAAPFAFLGAAWDPRLASAYHDPDLQALTRSRFAMFRNPSLFGAEPLRRLVHRYVDQRLLEAIAAEHAAGRRLMVATTNLDSQQSVIWDLGAIAGAASGAGAPGAALDLFRNVLIASASIPGVFPPVLIPRGDGRPSELHVDGGTASPFFVIPEVLVFWRPEHLMRPMALYVIVNGKVRPSYEYTGGGVRSIMLRAFDTLTKSEVRAQITAARVFADANHVPLLVASIPDEGAADPLDFRPPAIDALFRLGVELASQGRAFRSASEINTDLSMPPAAAAVSAP